MNWLTPPLRESTAAEEPHASVAWERQGGVPANETPARRWDRPDQHCHSHHEHCHHHRLKNSLALHLLCDFIETIYVQNELELGFNSEPPMTILQSLLWAVSWR